MIPAVVSSPPPLIASGPATTFVLSSHGDRLPVRLWQPAGSSPLPSSPRSSSVSSSPVPSSAKPRRAVVALHGMVTHSGWFAGLGAQLAAQGIAVVAPDRRGNGLAGALGEVGNAELLIADVAAAVALARQLGDDVTLLAWCGSANFAVPAAAAAGETIQRLVLASPGLVPLEARAVRFAASQSIDGFLPLHFDPARDFTDDEEVRGAIAADPLTLRRIPEALRQAWRTLNPLARQALGRLPMPARCVLTPVDRMIDVPRTVELVGRLAGMPVRWAEGGHGFLLEAAGARALVELLSAP